MPAELFRTVAVRRRSSARRLGAVPLSIAFHAALLVAVVSIPLVATTSELPPPNVPVVVQLPSMPVTAVPSPPAPRSSHTRLLPPEVPIVPLVPPVGIHPEDPVVRAPEINDLPPGQVLSDPDIGEKLTVRDLPPPPPPAPKRTGPVKPGGDIAVPRKIHNVAPVYPQLAVAAHVEGTVIIEAVISTTGAVQDARVVQSIPLLDAAALDAVRQWVFTPTRLNGEPVPVILTVKVEFRLQ